MHRSLRRSFAVTVASAGLVMGTGSSAFAMDCVIGVHSTNAPNSANWASLTALQAAVEFASFSPTACDAKIAAGYAALRAAHAPLSLKVRTDKEIGANSRSPRMADGRGLDHFDEGSPYPRLVIGTFLAGAATVSCPTA